MTSEEQELIELAAESAISNEFDTIGKRPVGVSLDEWQSVAAIRARRNADIYATDHNVPVAALRREILKRQIYKIHYKTWLFRNYVEL